RHRLDDGGIAGCGGVRVEVHRRTRVGRQARGTAAGWVRREKTSGAGPSATAATASASSTTISASVQPASDCRMRSLMRHSGSRTLHLLYWTQPWSSVEQAVTVSGPSTAWITSAIEISLAGRDSR